MTNKTTYEELEQRITELENDYAKCKQAEQLLRKSNDRYRKLFDNSTAAIFRTSIKDGKVLAVNETGVKMLRFSSKQELISEFDANKAYVNYGDRKRLLKELNSKGQIDNFEAEYYRRDKSTFWGEFYAKIYPEEGYLEGAVIDISKRKQAEKALQESEDKYRKLFATVPDAIMVFDAETKDFIDANDAVSTFYGYTKEEFLELKQTDITAEPEKSDESIKQTVAGEISNIPIRYHKRKDGTMLPVEISTGAFKLGNRQMVYGVARDITKRRKAEEALQKAHDELEQRVEERTVELLKTNERLKESEEHFRQLAEGTFEAIVLHEEGIILEANEQFYEMVGYNPEELAGKDVISLTTTPESVKKVREQIFLGNLGPYEIIGVKKDGTKFPMESRIKLIEYKGRKVRMAAIRDLTERKQAEEALRESEERYRSVVENAGELIWQVDTEGKFVFFNKYAEKVSGEKSADWRGKHYAPFVHPDDLAHVNKILEDTLAGNIIEYETRIFNKDGAIVDLEIQTMPIYVDGEVTGTLNFGRDITDRKLIQDELKKRKKELELKAENLEELNTAMKVLLNKREQDKMDIEDNVLTNVKELVEPYFRKINKTKLDDQQTAFLSIMEYNLKEITSPFTRKMSQKHLSLTPREIQIANLISYGSSSKEIAEHMNISRRTVDTHRKNIRRKIGLHKKSVNLRSYLLSLH
jgi:PAS domain S-box-containing protein